jgi:sugar phosphate isomerase/epimerase
MIISNTLATLDQRRFTALESMILLHAAGFSAVDICFFKYAAENRSYGETPFFSDSWEAWADELGEYAFQNGIIINQAHGVNFNYFASTEEAKLLDKMVDRSFEICHRLKIPRIVMHPIAPPGKEWMLSECLKSNTEYFKRKSDLASGYGIDICIENMLSNNLFDGTVNKRYCTCTDELIELVSTVNCANVGICLDVGHSHYMSGDEVGDILAVKDYLRAVHIHDNDRWNDEHLSPYQGTINWDGVCKSLAQAKYKGDLTLETSLAVSRMPDEIIPDSINAIYKTAKLLAKRLAFYSGNGGTIDET